MPLKAFDGVPVEPLAGKVVIDTNNYYPERDGHIAELEDETTTVAGMLQRHLPDVAGGQGVQPHLRRRPQHAGQPAGTPGRRALAIAGDDADAKATVGALIDEFGFDVVDAGPLAEGWRIQRDTPAYGPRLDADELRAGARRGEALPRHVIPVVTADAGPPRPARRRASQVRASRVILGVPASFVVVPQWQGSASSRAMRLVDGAEAIRGDLPASATRASTCPSRPARRSAPACSATRPARDRARERPLQAARGVPGRPVVTIGGDCGVELAPHRARRRRATGRRSRSSGSTPTPT